jgi:uncharacterized protein YjbJ (UPF0337 family)
MVAAGWSSGWASRGASNERGHVEGHWVQLKGRVRKQWGKLTNDDMASIQGSREVLLGRLQERYGHTREEVEREFDDWSVKPR